MRGLINAPGLTWADRGAKNGVAPLDENGRVPEAKLPVQSGLVAQRDPPDNVKLGWIDTANGNILKYFNGTSWVPIGSVWG